MRRTWDISQLKEAVATSKNLSQVAAALKLSPRGGNLKTIAIHIAKEGLDTNHFESMKERMDRIRDLSRVKLAHTLESAKQFLFQPNTRFTQATRRFAKMILDNEHCSICGHENIWNNLPLVLQIDHIDGDIRNNAIENLRFICANCHTQTETFSTRKN